MWAKKFVLIVMITLFLQLQWSTLLWAQAQTPTVHTDCTAFPTCKIYVPTTAALSQPTLIANGEPVAESLYMVEEVAVGTAVAFAFHEYTNTTAGAPSVRAPGATGEPRFVEFRNAVTNFIDYAETATWDAETYWLAAYRSGDTSGNGSAGELPTLAEWESGLFRNEVYNKVNDYTTSETKNTPVVPLYDLIDSVITEFDKVESTATHAEKALVVFTNGLLDGSNQDRDAALGNNTVALDALLAHATEKGVRIHVVLLVTSSTILGPELAGTLRRNAEAIATPTGGQVVWLGDAPNPSGNAALTPLWEQIGESRFQEVLTANLLDLADAGAVPAALQIGSATGSATVARPALPNFQPPTITEATLTPTQWTGVETLDLQFQPTWSDNYGEPARLGPVQYVIRNGAGSVVAEYVDQTAPFTATTIPTDALSALTDGSYTISAQFTDKLLPTVPVSTTIGTVSVALPVPTPVITTTPDISGIASTTMTEGLSETTVPTNVIAGGLTEEVDTTTVPGPDEPADPTDMIATVQQVMQPIVQGLRPWGELLLWPAAGLLLLLVGIGGWRRWNDGRRQYDTIRTSDPPDDHTLPDDQTEPDIEGFPVARLIYDAGDGNLLPEIPLYPSNGVGTQWTVGRSYQERDCYINHPRVSRYHALLLEKDGRFYIRHQGSSGGTYVNRVPLDALVDHRLQDGDLLHFSTAVAYRFQIEDAQPQGEQTEPAPADVGWVGARTEPEPQDVIHKKS